MADIHHLLCTHCTFGTSALEDTAGDAAAKVLGYSVRASSMSAAERPRLREEFRAIERLLSYDLPGDSTAEHKKRLDAVTAPLRLCYLPDISGRQVVGHVAFRQFDTANRPGSYFAHLLVGSRSTAWCPLECLRLWGVSDPSGRRGWAVADRSEGFPDLRPVGSLKDWPTADRAWLSDDAVRTFLRTGTGRRGVPTAAIPERWSKDVAEAERIALVELILQTLLEEHALPAVVLAAEPAVAAIFFYAALRLLPPSLRAGVGFSTYETDPSRASVRLVATTFVSMEGDLRPQAYQADSLVANTFRRPSFAIGSCRPRPGTYATWSVRRLLSDELERVDDLARAVDATWQDERPQAMELDRLPGLEEYRSRLFRGKSDPMPDGLTAGLKRFLAARCSQKIRRNIDGLTAMTAGDAAALIRRLERVFRPVPSEWEKLKRDDAIADWMKNAQPLDEKNVVEKLFQPPTIIPDDEAADLVVACDCVTRDRRLPAVSSKSRRLWGDFPAGDAETEYVPTAVFMKILDRLPADALDRLLPRPLPPLQVIVGIVRAINARIESADAAPEQAKRVTLFQAHLRRALDDAAGDKPGGEDPIEGLSPNDFDRLLSDVEECRNSYSPTPGNFGDRITRFVTGFPSRVGEVCSDKRLMKLAAAWRDCSTDSEQLGNMILAWRTVLRMFANIDTSERCPWRDPVPENMTGRFQAELKNNAKVIIPGDAIFDDRRRQLMRRIVEEFVKHGWLKARTPGRWWPRSQSAEHPLAALIDDAFKPSR